MTSFASAPAKGPAPAPSKGIPPVQVPRSTPAKAPVSPPKAAAAPKGSPGLPGPDQTLTGPQLYQAAQALATAKYGPSLQDYANSIAQENAQYSNTTNLTAGYFNQLAKSIGGMTGEENRIGTNLNSELQGYGNQLQSGLRGIGQGAQAITQQYAPQGDQSVIGDTGVQAQLAKSMAQQEGIGAQLSNSYRAAGAQQGANWAQLTNAMGGAAKIGAAQDLTQLANANAAKLEPLNAKVGMIYGEEGNDTLNNFFKLRQQEVTNQIANATLGTKQQAAQTGVLNAKAHLTSAQASLTNAGTNQVNARTKQIQAAGTLHYQQGQLSINEQKANNQAIYDAGILGVDRQKAADLASYNQVKGQQGWAGLRQKYAALSEKAQHDLWQHTYQQGELNLRQQAAAAKANKANAAGGGKPLSTLENNTATLMLSQTIGYIHSEQGRATRQQIDQALSTGRYAYSKNATSSNGQAVSVTHGMHTAVNPVLIEAAHELINKGTLEPRTAKLMYQMGMRGTSYNGSPIRIRK